MNGHDYPELFEPTDDERRRVEDDETARRDSDAALWKIAADEDALEAGDPFPDYCWPDDEAEAVWLYTPAMHLQAFFDWGRAYRRGLVSDREMSRYGLLVEASPLSWKGWVKALIDFGNEEIAS